MFECSFEAFCAGLVLTFRASKIGNVVSFFVRVSACTTPDINCRNQPSDTGYLMIAGTEKFDWNSGVYSGVCCLLVVIANDCGSLVEGRSVIVIHFKNLSHFRVAATHLSFFIANIITIETIFRLNN